MAQSAPLTPITSPLATLLSHLDPAQLISVVFTIVFVILVLYTLIAIYHWFRYNIRSWFTVPLLVLHLFVSGWLVFFTIGGLRAITG